MLENLYEFAQQCAEAMANALEVEVIIINNELIRIAGTGKYKSNIGGKIPTYYLLTKVIKNGESFVEETFKSETCYKCLERDTCDEKGYIGVPIMDGSKVLGAIGLTFITEKQLEILINKKESLLKFSKNIAELLASKIKEDEIVRELELNNSQLDTIFSSINDGILLTDADGIIKNCSESVSKLLKIQRKILLGQKINDIFEEIGSENTKNNQKNSQFRELKIKGRKEILLGFISRTMIENMFKGEIILLMKPKNIESLIYRRIHEQQIFKFNDMIGESQVFIEAVELAKKVANFNSNVLILGESGTGKELFARAIHNNIEGNKAQFIAINCAAIPEMLLESELFGYEEGAFTGAKQTGKPGKFELANGGTIFLDEIGDMPLHLQVKLLRVLQENVVERIGGTHVIPINVRIISATNKNLKKMIENQEFREDLYYRLNVFEINIPSLKERKSDIPLLVQHFICKYCDKLGIMKKRIEDDAMTALINYEWKGNIRELQNTIEYLCCISSGEVISLNDVKGKIQIDSFLENYKFSQEVNEIEKSKEKTTETEEIMPIKYLEKREIEKALEKYGHTLEGKSNAAKALDISRATLYRKLKEYNINSQSAK